MGGREERAAPEDVESDTVLRVTVAAALARLEERDRELIALRYGADLSARKIAALLGLKTNAVEVALHRARAHLGAELGETEQRPSGIRRALGPALRQAEAP